MQLNNIFVVKDVVPLGVLTVINPREYSHWAYNQTKRAAGSILPALCCVIKL
jgi:hypothetical protein